jgi:hypothetical protein
MVLVTLFKDQGLGLASTLKQNIQKKIAVFCRDNRR